MARHRQNPLRRAERLRQRKAAHYRLQLRGRETDHHLLARLAEDIREKSRHRRLPRLRRPAVGPSGSRRHGRPLRPDAPVHRRRSDRDRRRGTHHHDQPGRVRTDRLRGRRSARQTARRHLPYRQLSGRPPRPLPGPRGAGVRQDRHSGRSHRPHCPGFPAAPHRRQRRADPLPGRKNRRRHPGVPRSNTGNGTG